MNSLDHSPNNSLTREERLRGRGAISQLFGEGESGFIYPLRYLWCRGASATTSLLFTVPKKFHKRANKRNLLRRRVKEAYRLQKAPLVGYGLNIALIYSTKEILDYQHIAKAVGRIVETIAAQQQCEEGGESCGAK